jgi:hypothetical protein
MVGPKLGRQRAVALLPQLAVECFFAALLLRTASLVAAGTVPHAAASNQ